MTEKEALKRCGECEALSKDAKKGWVCTEMCIPTYIAEILGDECPLGIEITEVEEINKKGEAMKIQHGAREDKEKKERKPRPKDLEKEGLVSRISEKLSEIVENVTIINANNEIGFTFGGKSYSVKIVQHREKKKK